MKSLVLAVSLVALAQSADAVILRDGFKEDDSIKWANKHFPNVGQVTASFQDGCAEKSSCVLISPTAVLTAAHTVRRGENVNLSFVSFLDVAENVLQGEVVNKLRKVTRIVSHQSQDVDLAILLLEKRIVGPSPVKFLAQHLSVDQQCYIVGYGASQHGEGGKRRMGTTRISSQDKDNYYTHRQ